MESYAVKAAAITRHFDAVGPGLAEDLTERMLDGKAMYRILEQFLRGDIEAGQMAYEIQIAAEDEYRRMTQPEDAA